MTDEIQKLLALIPPRETFHQLHVAVEAGNIKEIDRLLASGVDINVRTSNGNTPLMCALAHRNIHIVRFLLTRGASHQAVNNKDLTALHLACMEGPVPLIQLLLDHGAHANAVAANKHGYTPICYAAGLSCAAVRILVKHGADPFCITANGVTPVHFAAGMGKDDAVKYLVSLGLSINARAVNGETPLDVARSHRQKKTVAVIMKLGGITGKTMRDQSS